MKDFSLYRIPITYLLFYVIAIVATGIWLFLLSQGLQSSEGLGSLLLEIIKEPAVKSLHNFVEVASPHMFSMGTLIFVLAHFMLFSTKISQKTSLIVSVLLFVLAFLNIVAYLPIIFGFLVSGWIKLLFMGLFVFVLLLMLAMLTFSL